MLRLNVSAIFTIPAVANGHHSIMMAHPDKERASRVDDRQPPTSPDDLTLMQAIAARDESAMRTLYDRHSALIHSLCLRILHDRQEAEDVMIDVFWELWNKSDRFDAARSSVSTYLVLLARSRALDRVRSRSKLKSEPIDNAAPLSTEPPMSVELDERRKLVKQTLAALDSAQREALECAFYDGLSHSEIAAKLNRPLGTIKTCIRQGMIRLRDALRVLDDA
jgi:RNA polymerase sigma-70 factor (ECF subfamily)